MKELILYTLYACIPGGYCYQVDENYHPTESQCLYGSEKTERYATGYKCVAVFRTEKYILNLPKKKNMDTP